MAAQATSTRRRAREAMHPAILLEIPANPSWHNRARLEALIEQLVAALDRMDGDPDLEPDSEREFDKADDEPDLGYTAGETESDCYAPTWHADDELDECDLEHDWRDMPLADDAIGVRRIVQAS